MIKELHQGNKILRENVQSITEEQNKNRNDNYHLQIENRDLRDRIEMYENVIGAQNYDIHQEAWRDLLSPNKESVGEASNNMSTTTSEITSKTVAPSILGANNNTAITSMINELVEFKKGSASSSFQLQAANKKNEELEM